MDKPFLTFDEQIEKLENEYNLKISNYEFAKEALSSLSYYDLINGYQSIYRSGAKYEENTTLEQLVSTHMFNKNIQGVLLKYSTYVENSFKTLLSYIIAERFTVHQNNYLNINNYRRDRKEVQRERLKTLLVKLDKTCKECTDTPTKHYRLTKNHIPPWILFRNVGFSDTTDLFKFLERNEKEFFYSYLGLLNITSLTYEDKTNIVIDALNLVRRFRNKIAHNLDFLTYRGFPLNKKANLLFTNTLVMENEVDITRNDIWAMVLSMIILLNNKYLIQNFLSEFNSFMILDKDLSKIYCNITGIPLDYEERIIKYLALVPL